jgi:4-diphosphocytidyl-2-C-methyl-D-erythritol kinase
MNNRSGSAKEFVKGRQPINRTVRMRAPAKVNLHLEVLRQRHDGYHEIETILQAITLFDELRVTLVERYPGGEPRLALAVSGPREIPRDETNLCWRAARHFCRQTGVSGKIEIELTKIIPAAAGLGGGSSDAAAVLIACDHLFATHLESERLVELGAALGADVPFFLRGGTAMGRGIGTRLTPLPAIRAGQFLIVKPGIHLKTQEVYEELKMGLTVNSAKANIGVIKPLLARFPRVDWPGFNRLEEVVLPSFPSVQRLVHRLRELAPVAMLSGSGSAAFAVFGADEDLTEIVAEFEQAGLYVNVVGPHPAGVLLEDGIS